MKDPLRLRESFKAGTKNDPRDVAGIADALRVTGFLPRPRPGAPAPSEAAVGGALRSFQDREGLKVDGIARPGGQTERHLSYMARRRVERAARPPRTGPIRFGTLTADNYRESRGMARGVVRRKDHRSAVAFLRQVFEDDPGGALPEAMQLAERVDILDRKQGARFRSDLVKMLEETEPTLAPIMASGRIPEGGSTHFTRVADTPRPRVQVERPFPEKPETPAPRISLRPPFPEKPEPPSVADSTWPESPLTAEFRDTIADLESKGMGDYQAFNPKEGGIGALGRYQIRKDALEDAKMLDANGDWTGEHGIDSAEAFMNDPLAQEQVFALHVDNLTEQLGKKQATDHIGQEIEGIEGKITITMNGLIGAAHREGAGGTNQYLTHLEKHGWKSDPDTFPENKRTMFLRVERRLRLLQDVPLFKDPAP